MSMARDTLLFLQRWLTDPRHVGAIAPSGRMLSELITRHIHGRSGRIAEFGAGTGVFTRALLARGVRERNLVLVERDEAFADCLRERFPQAQVLAMEAEGFAEWARGERFAASAIVSGLPLLSLGNDCRRRVLASAFASLCSDGALYQFTYGLTCPVPSTLLEHMRLEAACVGYAWRNLPPATVFRIQRRPPVATFTWSA